MSDASMDAMQEMAAPGPEHDRLKPFVGTFKAEVRIWMGPGEPMVSTGVMTSSLDLGDKFVRQDYKGEPSPEPTPVSYTHLTLPTICFKCSSRWSADQ